MTRRSIAALAAVLVVLAAPLLSGCSSSSSGSTTGASLTLSDGWAKSAEIGGMTGVFGTLTNDGAHDLVIEGVDSDAAGMVELHEVTADGVMQEIAGDVVIPAGGTFELAPGANHIMLMNLSRELLAGEEVEITLALSDGSRATFVVLVKDFAGANEEYDAHENEHEHEHDAHGSDAHH